MEKISVIIPTYCSGKYLVEAVESVRQQNWPGTMEIVIVDDGSEDNTLSVAKKVGDVVLSKKRGGAASARNLGVRNAKGDMLFFLDADDIVLPEAFEHLYAPFLTDKKNMAVFGMAEDFISPELTDEQRSMLAARKEPYGGVLPGCSLIRKEIFERIGFFDENLKSGETVAWQIKLRDMEIPVVNIDFVTIKRRLHLANTGRVSAHQEMLNYAAILRGRLKKR